jgi:sulfite exporter TauE/SafE
MSAELLTALGLGLVGSLHCIGMCGPIALALPAVRPVGPLLLGRLLYNVGRLIAYALIGIVFGAFGSTLAMAGLQQAVSIALGVVILAVVLLPRRLLRRLLPYHLVDRATQRLSNYLSRLFARGGTGVLLIVGILNGFLPCGLVYFAAAGATATGSVVSAIQYMVLFGLGTIPVMLAVSLARTLIGLRARRIFSSLVPIGAALLAVLLIMRGLSLGIPYVSPDLDKQHTVIEEPSCH